MGPTGSPETSQTNYQSTLRNIPDEQRPNEKLNFKTNDQQLTYRI